VGRNGDGARVLDALESAGERGREADVDAELAEEAGHDERGVTTDDVLENIVRSQRTSKLRLGDILKEMGLVTDEQVAQALSRQKETRKRLGQLLIDDGIVTQLDLTKALAKKFGVSFLDLTSTRFDGAATAYIDEKLARRYGAVPVRFLDDGTLLVAMVDPQNLPAQEDLAIITGFQIQPAIASEEDVFGAIAKIYRSKAEVGESEENRELDEESITDIRDATEEAPIVKLVNSVIAQSVDDGASDIHFEPQAKELVVRFRIDGVLHEIMSIPRRMQSGVISRLKIMAELDIAERRVPRTGASGSWSAASPSTCAWPRCPPCTARRSSCACSTSPTSCSTSSSWGSRRRRSSASRSRS
jgi:hypothetical protein